MKILILLLILLPSSMKTQREYRLQFPHSRETKAVVNLATCTENQGGSEATLASETINPISQGRGKRVMTNLLDWAEQYRSELEKQSSARAAQIESLLTVGDYEAVREWICQWEGEDSLPDSHWQRYCEARSQVIEKITSKDRCQR